ncbi:MAG: 2-aminobenzoate-CoA ligase, partial [Pseudomonadota bacterium]|nr:2-aminobenzoate-CoA ligase [Pseudomonadota bacterium]
MNPPAPSVQADRFVHDRLPPADQWPQMRYDLPELQVPAQANLVDMLFDRVAQQGLAGGPFLRSDKLTLTYADAHERVKRIAQVLT